LRIKRTKKYFKDFEVVDIINLVEETNEEGKILLEKVDDLEINDTIETVMDFSLGLGMTPTYCVSVIDKVVTIYFDKDCPEEKKEKDTYDREEFIEMFFEKLREYYN
jgi:hypothetical protein